MSLHAAIRKRVLSCAVGQPPTPWKRLACHGMGGLTSVGFARDSDLLLVITWQGRDVVDCTTGEIIHRDDDSDAGMESYSSTYLEARGLGPLADETLRMAGIDGGGFLNGTKDGWSVDAIALDWPNQHLLIFSEWSGVSDLDKPISKLTIESEEIRAFGFSPTGRSLIVATPCDLTVYGRSE